MSGEWIIQMHADGGYTIYDGDGEVAGKYANNSTSAAHHVFALQELRRMRKALELCDHVITKGIEVRMSSQWSALEKPLAQAKTAADEILRPQMTRIPVK